MNQETTLQNDEPVVQGPARRLGKTLLKFWGLLYAVVIVIYLVFRFYGSADVAVSDLSEGRRLWKNEVFNVAGERVETQAGDEISPPLLETIRKAYAEAGPEATITVFRKGALYNLPFPSILGLFNFVGLAIVMYMLTGDALPNFLAEHSNRVSEDLAEARAAKARAEELKKKREDMAREIEEEKKLKLKAAEEEAAREYDYLLEQRKEESQRFLTALEHHLGAEIHAAAERLKAEVAERAVEAARNVLKDGVGESTQNDLVEDFTANLKELNIS